MKRGITGVPMCIWACMGFPGVVTLPAAAAAVVARLTAAAAVVVPLAAVELCTARVPSKLRGKVSRLCSGWHTRTQTHKTHRSTSRGNHKKKTLTYGCCCTMVGIT